MRTRGCSRREVTLERYLVSDEAEYESTVTAVICWDPAGALLRFQKR